MWEDCFISYFLCIVNPHISSPYTRFLIKCDNTAKDLLAIQLLDFEKGLEYSPGRVMMTRGAYYFSLRYGGNSLCGSFLSVPELQAGSPRHM